MISKPIHLIVIYILFLLVSCQSNVQKDFSKDEISIIPQPKEVELKKGSFTITKSTKVIINDESQRSIASFFIDKFYKASGIKLKISNSTDTNNSICINKSTLLFEGAYVLGVQANTITLKAGTYGGFVYALQSLFQLLPAEIESNSVQPDVQWILPNIVIKDAPRYKWRGLMLDVSRHFFDKEYIKEVIANLAMHKMNVLHLHLVDDQGWRIEIKKYPKLIEKGAWRVDQENAAWDGRRETTADEKGTYGGYLTQEDLKEIVAYGQSLNVEIVPEIEMPAHVSSAIASYPELSCFEKPIGVPSGGLWPITDIYCAGKESTFEFLEDVLTEVMDIFPSQYIHIGGDEATQTNWDICPHCQKRIKEEGLKDSHELQSYFIKRMEKFINANGKKLMGWDEILEGGLAPNATVMSWRGVKGGIEAAGQGHDVVMTPNSHCYFDHYQGPMNDEPKAWGGYLPLRKVYLFDPVVASMTQEQANHVLGGQANLWSEFVPTNEQSEYMIYPRIAALSEAVWSPKESRDWDDFSNRVKQLFKRYDLKGLNYAKSVYLVSSNSEISLENNSVSVVLKNELTNSDIRYILGNNELNENSIKYTNPMQISETTVVKAALFEGNIAIGKTYIDTIKFHKAVGKVVKYTADYNDSYKGQGVFNLTNTIRGTKNFNDGQWQGWIGKDMEVVIDLENEQSIKKIAIGTMENQGSGIYFPIAVEVFTSADGKSFKKQGEIKRDYRQNGDSSLKDFIVNISPINTKFVKVKVTNLGVPPNGGGAWLFVDEIVID